MTKAWSHREGINRFGTQNPKDEEQGHEKRGQEAVHPPLVSHFGRRGQALKIGPFEIEHTSDAQEGDEKQDPHRRKD